MPKRGLGIDVLTAARQRIEWTFDNFEKIYCSFSAGKDSTVMLHLVMDEARKRDRKIGLFLLDWECQIGLTIDFAREMFAEYADHVEPTGSRCLSRRGTHAASSSRNGRHGITPSLIFGCASQSQTA